ncbi:hypothetical protein PVL29_015508 [Vitis rotundifolia]|uniref:Uncharacterized protein n=1 Tax=Vitis rotundifolia TaxID=103349 RepID=A0AA39DJV6_VITRO|nr:hypothetical protein PVL29_015508 [Vitis rotundifolia]
MSHKNLRTEQIYNDRIGRVRHRTRWTRTLQKHGLRRNKLLPLQAPGAVVPPGEARKGVDLRRQRRRGRRRCTVKMDLRVRVDSVRSGADPRIPELSECAWLQVPMESLVSLGG